MYSDLSIINKYKNINHRILNNTYLSILAPEYSYYYAKIVIKGRFILGEKIIRKSHYKKDYAYFLHSIGIKLPDNWGLE